MLCSARFISLTRSTAQFARTLALITSMASAVAYGAIVQFSGGPTTTTTDTELYLSPVTGEVSPTQTGDSLFGVSNAFGIIALAFNTTFDSSLVVAPNPVDPSISSVARLNAGTAVGVSSVFDATEYILAESSASLGNWNDLGTGFFGFQFAGVSGTHYGWANITVLSDFNVTLNSFAYETEAGVSIVTGDAPVPEPSTVVSALAGLGAILLYRRNGARKIAAGVALAVAVTSGSGELNAQPAPAGQSDPIGNRLTQFRSDNIYAMLPDLNANLANISTFRANFSDPFSVSVTDIGQSYQVPGWVAGRQFHAASGRILAPDRDQAVQVYSDGANIQVKLLNNPSADTQISNVLPRFNRTMPGGQTLPTMDYVAVAVGDLDRKIDASGNYHDEVVVAFVNASNRVQIAVLDYSNSLTDISTGAIAVVPPTAVIVDAPDGLVFDPVQMSGAAFDSTAAQSHILPVENILAVAVGDFDGDLAGEIALGMVATPQALTIHTLRYRSELSTVTKIGLQVLQPIPQSGYGPAIDQGAMAANVSLAAGDFYGTGTAQLAAGFLQWKSDHNLGMQFLFDNLAVAPRFLVQVLSASSQGVQTHVTAQPGNPTILSIDSSLVGKIPSQLTISQAIYSWSVINGTWPVTVTSDGKISIPVDTSSIPTALDQTLSLSLSNGLTLPSNAQPLIINPVLDSYNETPLSTFDYRVTENYPKIQLVSGLFKFDPGNNWPFSRRQLAVAYSKPPFCMGDTNTCLAGSGYTLDASIYAITSDNLGAAVFTLQNSQELTPAGSGPFAGTRWVMAAGGFRGGSIIDSNGNPTRPPIWSLALDIWYGNGLLYLLFLEPNGTAFNSSVGLNYNTNQPDVNALQALTNYDAEGNSVYLGAPIRLSSSHIYTPITILQEPPKHLAWLNTDGKGGAINNINRNDGFNIQMRSTTNQQISTSTTTASDSTFSAINTVTAGGTLKFNLFGVVKDTLKVQDSAKFTYDYNQNKSHYDSGTTSLSYDSGAETDHDDFINAQTQDLTVWRYRVYGPSSSISGNYPYYDLTFPGKPYLASGPGLDSDWYNPIHENGNLLSYPPLPGNGLPDDVGPAYLVNGATPPGLTNGVLYSGKSFCFGGTSGAQSISMTGVNGSGDVVGWTKNNAWDNDTKVSNQFDIFGSNVKLAWDGDFGKKQSWSSTTSTTNESTGSQTVTLNVDDGDDNTSYNMFPLLYNTDAGVLKFMHYVEIPTLHSTGDCSAGGKFWTDAYGGAPDPALNLPFRFRFNGYNKSTDTTDWSLNNTLQRERLRGFFIQSPVKSDIESTPGNDVYLPLGSNPTPGSTIRLAVRVYNYAIGNATIANNVQANFSAAPYDSEKDNELGCGAPPNGATGRYCAPNTRIPIGTTTIATIPSWTTGQNWTEAAINWAIPSDFISKSNTNEYRIYVNLAYPGTELNPPQKPCNDSPVNAPVPCPIVIVTDSTQPGFDPLAPGQNNEGFAYLTLQAPSLGIQSVPIHNIHTNIHVASDSLAAVDAAGKLKTGVVTAYLGQLLNIRFKAICEGMDVARHQKAFVYDIVGAKRKMIAGKTLQGVAAQGTHGWFQWTPTTLGLHQLVGELLEPMEDTTKGNNVAKLSVLVIRKPADVNSDGRVDLLDIEIVSRETGKLPQRSSCTACDVNGDGLIGKADWQRVAAACDRSSCAVEPTVSKGRNHVR